MSLRKLTLKDVRDIGPCYDPTRHVPEDWSGTVLDILRAEQVPAADRIWVAVRFIDDRRDRLFAAWCARQALAGIQNPDPRSLAACDAAEAFARGEINAEALSAAYSAAWSAAESAAYSAARSAASAAASAARSAAASAAGSAAWSAAWSAADVAARSAQIAKLAEMVSADTEEVKK